MRGIHGERLTATRWHRRMTYTKLGVPDYNQGVKDKEWQNREKRKKRPVAPWAGHDCHGEELCPCKGNITAETSDVSRRTRKERWSEGTSKLLSEAFRLKATSLDRKAVETLRAWLLVVPLPRSVTHTLPEHFPKVTTFSAFPGGWESQLKQSLLSKF